MALEIINYLYENNKDSVDKIISYENSIFSLSINTIGVKNYSNNYYEKKQVYPFDYITLGICIIIILLVVDIILRVRN